MEMGGQVHSLAALPNCKSYQYPTNIRLGRSPTDDLDVWRKEKALYRSRQSKHDPSVAQPAGWSYNDRVWVRLGAQNVVVQSLSILRLTWVVLNDRNFRVNILQQFYYYLFGQETVTQHSMRML